MVPTMSAKHSCMAYDVQADLDHIGTFLRQERKRQGLGLEDLAARAGNVQDPHCPL